MLCFALLKVASFFYFDICFTGILGITMSDCATATG